MRAFCRSEPPPGARVEEWVCGDVTDGSALAHAVRGCEAVVHAAALYSYSRADAPAMEAVNVEGTRNALEAAARGGIGRVLLTSTSATCGPVAGRPANEGDSPPRWELRSETGCPIGWDTIITSRSRACGRSIAIRI